MKQAGMVEAKVGDVYAALRREGLLDECTCERVELDWPDGVCFHCRLVAGRRALSQALVWAIQEVGSDGDNGAGREGPALTVRDKAEAGLPFVAALRTFGILGTAEVEWAGEEYDEQDE